jgi:hypothetical protein
VSTRPSYPEILARTESVYRSCRTYQDTGEITKVVVTGKWPWNRKTTKFRFKTIFAQPDRLFFEYTKVAVGSEAEWYREVSWGDGAGARSWNSLGAIVSHPGPAIHVIAGAFIATLGGHSTFIPLLLVYARTSLPDPSTAMRLEPDEVEGRACTRIDWRPERGRELAWIEAASALLLRREHGTVFDEVSRKLQLEFVRNRLASMPPGERSEMEKTVYIPPHGPDHRTEETTVWRPVLDEPVDPASLEFTPPMQAS